MVFQNFKSKRHSIAGKEVILWMSLSFVLSLHSCNSLKNDDHSFKGEEVAVQLADQMFDAIGGKNAWCKLKSLYIKAEHEEENMSIPYTSEIWRGIDRFDLVIEQQNDSFHVKGVFNKDGGTVRYFDARDTFRVLSYEQLKNWEFSHNHNIYVLLHEFACSPKDYRVNIDTMDRIAFYKDSLFICSFSLDDQSRPYLFYTPNPDGVITGTRFRLWGTDDGLVHSAGGHPLDSSFSYITEKWIPGYKSLEEVFGKSIYDIKRVEPQTDL